MDIKSTKQALKKCGDIFKNGVSALVKAPQSYVLEPIGNLVIDAIRPIRHWIAERQLKVVLTQLTDKALASPDGSASTAKLSDTDPLTYFFSNFPFFGKHIVVLTGEKSLKAMSEYGEEFNPGNDDPNNKDKHSRLFFKPIQEEFIGWPLLIALKGRQREERGAIMKYLTPYAMSAQVNNYMGKVLKKWDPKISINEQVHFAILEALIKQALNLDLPKTMTPKEIMDLFLLEKKAFVQPYGFKTKVRAKLHSDIKRGSKELLATNKDLLDYTKPIKDQNFMGYMLDRLQKTFDPTMTLEKMNAFSTLVVDSLPDTAMAAIIHLATLPHAKRELREELAKLDKEKLNDPKTRYSELNKSKFLLSIALESLRFYSVSPVVGRYASKAANIGGVQIPKNTLMFAVPRRMGLSEKFFANPLVFDPHRFEGDHRRPGTYPFIPFFMGKRACVGQNGSVISSIMSAIESVYGHYDLTLTGDRKRIEDVSLFMPVGDLLKHEYYGKLEPLAPQEEYKEERSRAFSPALILRRERDDVKDDGYTEPNQAPRKSSALAI